MNYGSSHLSSKSKINKAGDALRPNSALLTPEVVDALDVLGDWRTSHAYPLQCVYMKLRERARRVDTKALISQRLKRIPSIIYKLQRNPHMALTTVQDIGGCRAVMTDIRGVRKLANRTGNVVKDYITTPKSDGYRSIHLVETYQPSTDRHEAHAGRRIEIQIRTRLQHAWATAVETVDSTLQQNIKGGHGERDWRRFFVLASGLIALQEDTPVPSDCPSDRTSLIQELRSTAQKLDVVAQLHGLSSTLQYLTNRNPLKGSHAYVMVLDMEKRRTSITRFGRTDPSEVAAQYLKMEKEYFGDPRFQVVQVRVSKIRELKRAYPNYYLDTQAFLSFISRAIEEPHK